jgi:hypothetical protein
MVVNLTKDVKAISKVLNHPRVYKWLCDDCSKSPYVPPMDKDIIYLMDDTKKCVVQLSPMNGICCQVHIGIDPDMWGQGAKFSKKCILWAVKNTTYMKAVVIIPVFNQLTINMVKKCGFVKEGLLKKSFLKNWKLYDQEIYGITKMHVLSKGG